MAGRFALALLPLSLAACGPLVPEGSSTVRAPVSAPRPAAVSSDARQCLAALGAAGAGFSPVSDRYYGAGCSTVGTVSLSELQGDEARFTLANLGPVACPLAETAAAWARFGVDRAARQVFGSGLVRIETMGSYSCRDVAGSSRRSAHATARAIDVSAFILADGRRVSILGDWSDGSRQEREFLRLVHQSACRRFGTVLGPDYNAAHKDHLHLEAGAPASFCR
ncbi:hypothetical protein GCM10011515_07280 [Tsuneonella deserti]|uniref:Extensin-like C-terminal domain-containing protein n=1 Tax=Tsuneonella deserti TaxID=2035528 RepID=A0ABQ1S5G1_9SPHN|nr:extensin family protein [Tsuneonella deserti]GGD90207.1 hypothetical protein GCM10011515_07280 [Tsuneonella deserti]